MIRGRITRLWYNAILIQLLSTWLILMFPWLNTQYLIRNIQSSFKMFKHLSLFSRHETHSVSFVTVLRVLVMRLHYRNTFMRFFQHFNRFETVSIGPHSIIKNQPRNPILQPQAFFWNLKEELAVLQGGLRNIHLNQKLS